MFDIIAFDADDTLWHNNRIFVETRRKFSHFLAKYQDPESIEDRLNDTELANLQRYGYGVKGFALSMIETAIELTGERITAAEIKDIIKLAWEMQTTPLGLIHGVRETIDHLSKSHTLTVITKGDLFDQEAKIAQSGLGSYFTSVEIVSEKNQATYESIIRKHNTSPDRFLMVGNSLKSDILPVLAIGGWAVYIPYETTWVHEAVADFTDSKRELFTLSEISLLPELLYKLERKKSPGEQPPENARNLD
jgi:putative hydrolase of the HAD superfamily